LYELAISVSATCQEVPLLLTRMAVPTKRLRVTLRKVVNLSLRMPGKMMKKATYKVTKTVNRVIVVMSPISER